jgi:hypothetical protein
LLGEGPTTFVVLVDLPQPLTAEISNKADAMDAMSERWERGLRAGMATPHFRCNKRRATSRGAHPAFLSAIR